MLKRCHFKNPVLPYLLVFPQLLITFLFFFWPGGEAITQAFLRSDPFGGRSEYYGLNNFKQLFIGSEYFESVIRTFGFSLLVSILSLSSGLTLAVLVSRIKFFKRTVQSLFIWPYAVAPAIAGALWLFMFHPSNGLLSYGIKKYLHWDWNPVLSGSDAFILVSLAASWKQVSYNFIFFLGGLLAIPRSLMEAAAIDGAGPFRRFWSVTFPMLTPTLFFLLVMNMVYSFFETFGIIHAVTQGGPGGSTNILVYKVYADGFVALDLGRSAAQSVILMIIAIAFTAIQFRYIEKKVNYN